MSSLNKVLLMGNLTRDPQLSYLPSQTPVCEFGLAVNRTYKKQDGSQGQDVCFVDCQIFGKRAEVINKYFSKGMPIFVEGRLKFDSWQAQDGSKRSKLRVFVENFEFIGSKNSNQQGDGGDHQGEAPYGGNQDTRYSPPNNGTGEDLGEDDIPF